MAKQVEHLTMSKEVVEVGDRAGEGNAHGNLGLVSSMVVIYLQKCTGAPHRLRCGPRGRGAGASQRAPLACATWHLRRITSRLHIERLVAACLFA